MKYLVIIYKNTTSTPSNEEWDQFVQTALRLGVFKGGSELGPVVTFGAQSGNIGAAHIAGFMHFETNQLSTLKNLLLTHPTVVHGGTIELSELPNS